MGDKIDKLDLDNNHSPSIDDMEIIDMLFKGPLQDSSSSSKLREHLETHTHSHQPSSQSSYSVTDILFSGILFLILCSPQFDKIVEKITRNKNYNLVIKLLLFLVLFYLYKCGLFL